MIRRSSTVLRLGPMAVLCVVFAGCTTLPQPTAAPAPALPSATVLAQSPQSSQPTQPAALPEATPAAAIAAEISTKGPAPAAASAAPPARSEAVARSRLDPLDDASRGDLWLRLRSGFAMPDLDSALVRKWEQHYAQRPDYVQRMATRGSRYLFHIVEELERRQMPSDLALLPFIESAFDPQALSVARASGMWQFMPGTGRDFELKQNLFRDDRRDILASTRAALDYLQKLHGMFDDWHLALAAYNWGQGNVLKALARNAATGVSRDYSSLRMPDETRNYVPKLQAIKNMVARPEAFGLVLPPLENHPYFITVAIDRDIDVALAARLAGLTLDQFQQLNPQLNKPVILAAGTPQVLLPYDNANRFVKGLDSHRGPLASWTAWVAPRTLKAQEAARHVGMTEDDLREVNRIPARMMVTAGSTLLVPRSAQHLHDVAERVADNAKMALAPEALSPRRLQVKVGRKGESVTSLAKRHGMSAAQLAAANGVAADASFKPGQLVTVLQPQRKAGPVRLASAPKSAARKPASSHRPAARVRVAQR